MFATGATNPARTYQYKTDVEKPDLRDTNSYKIRINWFSTTWAIGSQSARFYLQDEDSNTEIGYYILANDSTTYNSLGNGWYYSIFDYNNPNAGTFAQFDGKINNFAVFFDTNAGYTANDKLGFDYIVAYTDANCGGYDGNAMNNAKCKFKTSIGTANNYFIDANVFNGTESAFDSGDANFTIASNRLTIKFIDEKTGNGVNPTTLTIDGNSWTSCLVDSNGLCNIKYLTAFGDKNMHSVIAGKTGYGTRQWDLNIGQNVGNDYNFSMLPTLTGKNIDFQYYLPGQTNLANNYYAVPKFLNYYWTGAKITDTQGRATFFVDANNAEQYTVDLTSATNNQHYTNTKVSVLVPKSESDLTAITPYGLQIQGLGLRDYNGLTAQRDFNIFSNTMDTYLLTINDANQNLWLQRSLLLQTKADTNFLTIEPLLPSVAEGITSTIFVVDPNTKEYLRDITVKLKRDFNGTSTELFSNKTDAAGTVSVSMLYLQNYFSEFYSGNNLIYSGTIEAKSNSYYALLDLNYTGFDFNRIVPIDINFSGSSVIQANAAGRVKFDQNISGNNLSSITILTTNGNNTVYNQTFTSADTNFNTGHFEQNFNIYSASPIKIDENQSITIKITIIKTDGKTITRWKSYGILEAGAQNLKTNLTLLKDTFGQTGIQLFALFITICAVGGMTRFLAFGGNNATMVGMILLGLFTYVGWFDSIYFLLLCLAAFVIYFLTRRETE